MGREVGSAAEPDSDPLFDGVAWGITQCGFVFVSGNLALDFVGTRKWRATSPVELLETPADLSAWAGAAGLYEALNAAALNPPLVVQLEGSSARSTGDVLAMASTLARSAIRLLGSQERAALRQCEGNECTRVYVDRSHGSTRRWCGMAECGNRSKALRYRARRRLANG